MPGLSHSSLILTRKFCDAGCKVVFEQHECRVIYEERVVLVGARNPTTGLWHLPINPATSDEAPAMDLQLLPNQRMPQRVERAANMHTLPHKQQQLKYMHQAFLCPPNASLVKAINNEQLKGIPLMSADNVRKFLPKSPATAKGGMKRVRTNIRSTRPKTNKRKGARRGNRTHDHQDSHEDQTTEGGEGASSIPNEDGSMSSEGEDEDWNDVDIVPTELHEVNNIFCFAALADKKSGTMYTDQTGALPAISLDGHQYFFVAYDYDSNYIYAVPVKDLKDDTILEAFDQVFSDLKNKGHKPKFNVTDNQAAKPIKEYLAKEDCKWQFVEPSNHRVNVAERAIQTFKSHFIRGLCYMDNTWPL